MKRSELEHILRACRNVTGETEFVVIGSQAILGAVPDAPRELRQSMEADIYPRRRPDLAGLIEGSLGRYSRFNETFGYYADGVGPDTATAPPGWEDRLVPLTNEHTGGAVGWCLDPHDVAYSKLAARRDKDLDFVAALLRFKIVKRSRLEKLIASTTDAALREELTDALAMCRNR